MTVCHLTEDLFNLLRAGEKTLDADMMDVVLQALDVVQAQFDEIESGQDPTPAPDELLARLRTLIEADAEPPAAAPQPPPAAAARPQLATRSPTTSSSACSMRCTDRASMAACR